MFSFASFLASFFAGSLKLQLILWYSADSIIIGDSITGIIRRIAQISMFLSTPDIFAFQVAL